MNEIDDKALHAFFKNEKKEIEDNGFSRRVINNLPNRENRLSKIWVSFCTIVGLTLFFVFNGLEAILFLLREGFYGAMKQGIVHLDFKTILIAMAVIIGLGINEVYCANKE